jgi:DNA-binding MurR/RpiR family transcriptional regulator
MRGRGRGPGRRAEHAQRRLLRARRHLEKRAARRLLRLSIGSYLLYRIAGTDNAVKLKHEDAAIVESESGKPITEMDEAELVQTMQSLDIKSISLTDEEKKAVLLSCPYCGHRNEEDARTCENCGASI